MPALEAKRIEALQATEPKSLRIAHQFGGTPTRTQRLRAKLPVEIHGETLWVDDMGLWYASSSEKAQRLQDASDRRTDDGEGGPLPLEMAEAYARAVLRRMGGVGRLLFTPNWPAASYRYPPGAVS